jgi:hypothetical protein
MTPPSSAEIPVGDPGRSSPFYASETIWMSRTQWGAILIGSFAGLAVVIVMGTLGAALGITAGSIGIANMQSMNQGTADSTGSAFTIGAAIWMLLTALVTGLVGGWALNATARRDRPYSSFIFGGVCWAVGVCVSLALASPAIGGTFAGLGGGAGAAVGAAAGQSNAMYPMSPLTKAAPGNARTETPAARAQTPMTDEEKTMAKDAAERTAAAATGAAWVLLGSQLISIAATMFAAGWNRHTGTRVVTEIRPRPAPTA